MSKSAVTTKDLAPSARHAELLRFAGEAEARYDHETAVAHYSSALKSRGLDQMQRYEILAGRAAAYQNWGYADRYIEDLMALITLAAEMEDSARMKAALVANPNIFPYMKQEQVAIYIDNAEQIRGETANDALDALIKIARAAQIDAEDSTASRRLWNQALDSARSSGNTDLIIPILATMANGYALENQPQKGWQLISEARQLADETGSLRHRVLALFVSGIVATDLAVRRTYYEQALADARTLNNQVRVEQITNEMGLLMWKLGLYNRALAYLSEAKTIASQLGRHRAIVAILEGLGRAYLGKGLLDDARRTFQQGIDLSDKRPNDASWLHLGLAFVAIAAGEIEEAISQFSKASETYDPVKPIAYSGLSAAYRLMGNEGQALEYSTRALTALEKGGMLLEYLTQEIWWRHFQVLHDMGDSRAFETLNQALQVMLASIASLSDEGLRRNYLNKIGVNREISIAWTAEAANRGLPLDPFTAHEPPPGNLREQFRRVVEIGGRLSSQHDPQKLAGFIVEEFVEMSGAERLLLLLLDRDGTLQTAASFNPDDIATTAESLFPTLAQDRQPVLRHDVGAVPAGEVARLHQRSAIALPLIAQGKLLGMIYGDMRQIFGRFDDADLNLLSMLANQAASALENARLVSTLEVKVEERTAELRARVNELALINSVQQGLATKLDFQAIVDLVGDKLRSVFEAPDLIISWYHEEDNLIHYVYLVEQGKRLTVPAAPPTPGGLFEKLTKTREPLMLNSVAEMEAAGIQTIPGTTQNKSILCVPIISNNRVLGLISLENYEWENAYGDSDLHLLTTIAASLGTAMQNARLYTEAQEAKHAAEDARLNAEHANEAKSRFLANMSHELRTPLNAIIGFTRIIKRKTSDVAPQRQLDNMDKVLSSAEHLLGLINTVLDIAKIEAGHMDVVNSRFEVAPLIDVCAMTTQPLLHPGVKLKQEVAPDLPPLVTDQDKLKQILLNLLSNAAKFTHKGAVTIHAQRVTEQESSHVERRLPAGSDIPFPLLVIDIIDTGIGMDDEQLGRVFEEFQQAGALTSRQYGGTGLGLPISKQLAHLLGGDLTAESRPGDGATFTVVLPWSTDNIEHKTDN